MWLTKKETAEKAESVKTGVVTTGGGKISVCTELERCARAFCGAFTHFRTARTRRRTAVRR